MSDRETLGTPDRSPDQVVCHVDVDCFYAACERLREPALRGEPLVVGMGYEPGETHGAVATASYEARAVGVESAMAISEALERLPRKVEAARDPDLGVDEAGFYRPVDMEYYESVAADVKSVLHDRADVVREVSVDEAYLDITDRARWPDQSTVEGDRPTVEAHAREIKQAVREEAGVVASVGVAPTMSAAKIASDHDKPDGLVVVEPGEVRGFLGPLEVEEIHNVGPVTARRLREMGIETAGELAAADPDALADTFGERGLEVRRFARGEDPREVEPVGEPKSLSRESAFTEATDDLDRKRERVRSLAADVAERAEYEGALYRTIGIKVVEPPFDVHTRAESLPGPVQDGDLVERQALDLLDEFSDAEVRKLGVRVSNLSFVEGDQTSLTGFEGETRLGDGASNGDGDRPDPGTDAPSPDTRRQSTLTEFT
ncbi:DNA polymerase IV [Halobacteriales archaeon QH_7_68_42]|nr:MAG: DNA polymerase IV [Halobacteriales archaeon QH_7_68_42]